MRRQNSGCKNFALMSKCSLLLVYLVMVLCSIHTHADAKNLDFYKNGLAKKVPNVNNVQKLIPPSQVLVSLSEEAAGLTKKLCGEEDYKLEEVRTTTPDGYNLIVHKIQKSKNCERIRDGEGHQMDCIPVLLAPEAGSTSAQYVLGGRKKSLAFQLSENCMDVFMLNHRGSVFSSHMNLSRDTPTYWEFGWSEIGKIDLASAIDLVLEHTGYKQLNFVGFSFGASIMYILLSTRPEYNEKIRRNCLMSPVAHWSSNAYLSVLPTPYFAALVDATRITECYSKPIIVSSGALLGSFLPFNFSSFNNDMGAGFGVFSGGSLENFDEEMLRNFKTSMQSGISVRVCGQVSLMMAKQGRFSDWDGKPYDLTKVITPTTVFYSKDDRLNQPQDVKQAISELKNPTPYEIDEKKFGHYDFAYGKNVDSLVFKPILAILNETGCSCSN